MPKVQSRSRNPWPRPLLGLTSTGADSKFLQGFMPGSGLKGRNNLAQGTAKRRPAYQPPVRTKALKGRHNNPSPMQPYPMPPLQGLLGIGPVDPGRRSAVPWADVFCPSRAEEDPRKADPTSFGISTTLVVVSADCLPEPNSTTLALFGSALVAGVLRAIGRLGAARASIPWPNSASQELASDQGS
jgi:hypothetical protein